MPPCVCGGESSNSEDSYNEELELLTSIKSHTELATHNSDRINLIFSSQSAKTLRLENELRVCIELIWMTIDCLKNLNCFDFQAKEEELKELRRLNESIELEFDKTKNELNSVMTRCKVRHEIWTIGCDWLCWRPCLKASPP